MAVNAIPDGYHAITPYLVMKNAAAAIDFYTKAFGAKEVVRMPGPDDTIGHAEMLINGSHIMLADEHPEMGFLSPETIGGTPVSILIYIDDVDSVFNRAIAAGGRELRPLMNQFYGDRSGTLKDPFGHVWTVATHIEDVSGEEMERRLKDAPGAA